MILVTATCEPPSCAAMLPQKFSAATTVSTEEPADVEGAAAVLVPFPQPARRRARLTESPIPRAVQGVDRMLDLTTGNYNGNDSHCKLAVDNCSQSVSQPRKWWGGYVPFFFAPGVFPSSTEMFEGRRPGRT